ncbi:unnamed protein product [Peniophora sp. CBMAI 1063]|nr:unnamed protein product [Peniophora sp. CBMAI 1063]
MRTFSASLVLAALVAGPAIAAPLTSRNVNVNQDGPHFILPRSQGLQSSQSSQPLQSASASPEPSIELPLNFQPIGPAVTVSKREPVQPVSFIPVGAALDGTNSAPPADTAPADTAVETASASVSAPASTSTGTPVGTRPVSFIPVGAALGGNTKREPVQSPPIVSPGTFGGVPPASSSATESAPATSQSASTGVRPVSFIPVNALQGEAASKRASTIHSVSFIPEGALEGNAKRIVDPIKPLPVNSPIDYAGAQKREPVHPVSFIPVSALTGAQRKARRQEASTIPPAGSAPGTVPATVTYSAGQSDGPMMCIFREDGSVVAMPAASGTV